jgi:hypothetical protein
MKKRKDYNSPRFLIRHKGSPNWYIKIEKPRRIHRSTYTDDLEKAKVILEKTIGSCKNGNNGRITGRDAVNGYKIYFVQVGTEGPIKIGISKNIETRLRDMRVSNPQSINFLGVYRYGSWWRKLANSDTMRYFLMLPEQVTIVTYQ